MEGSTTQDEIHQEEKDRSGSSEGEQTDQKERGIRGSYLSCRNNVSFTLLA